MNAELVRSIADAVLYEGYMLYPCRPTSVKNRQRWTFGGLYPESFTARYGDASSILTELLVVPSANPVVKIHLRFLHPLSREAEGTAWQEAMEREIDSPELECSKLLEEPYRQQFSFPAWRRSEDGFLLRQERVDGGIKMRAKRISPELYKLSIRVSNLTAIEMSTQVTRDEALLSALVSTHAIVTLTDGEFVSATDPPERFREAAAACRNLGVWPVLAGEEGSRDCMLASPIVLYDYPQVAPESPGDLFDGAEIDEILTLRILTMTPEEKEQMRRVDERTRRMLERTEALSPQELEKLHGAFRTSHAPLKRGDRVRLWPKKSADIMDIALKGRVAEIEAVEVDFENQVHLAVVLEDDPGRDLGALRQPGHRFFFSLDEVEPL